ncbi:nucleoside deaminase [Paenibacillus sp. 481]|uniref:nucleoside deaminase n=1 Tax=Paenibacillus sp. 481 TaxID=2835869 RepID=UPI001E4F048B|nr:nucleoside deaminase [Paenibacillus sp. 481]UHA71756.1 nucleoside deaminase [Paenibacillus sp. 481]
MDSNYQNLLLAFEEAELAKAEGTYPIGAVIVDSNGQVVSRGRNRVFSECDCTAHAEVDAIRKAGNKLLDLQAKRFIKNDLTIYTTCEPCPMCTCTILLSGIKKVVWAANDNEYGAMSKMKDGPHFLKQFNTITYIAAPYLDLENRQRSLLEEWNKSRGMENTEWQQLTAQE